MPPYNGELVDFVSDDYTTRFSNTMSFESEKPEERYGYARAGSYVNNPDMKVSHLSCRKFGMPSSRNNQGKKSRTDRSVEVETVGEHSDDSSL